MGFSLSPRNGERWQPTTASAHLLGNRSSLEFLTGKG